MAQRGTHGKHAEILRRFRGLTLCESVIRYPSRDKCMGTITKEEMKRRLSDPLNLWL